MHRKLTSKELQELSKRNNKTNSRRHMAVDNLHSGKALVSDYALDKKTAGTYSVALGFLKCSQKYRSALLGEKKGPCGHVLVSTWLSYVFAKI